METSSQQIEVGTRRRNNNNETNSQQAKVATITRNK